MARKQLPCLSIPRHWPYTNIPVTKYTHKSYAACAPMMDKTRSEHWL